MTPQEYVAKFISLLRETNSTHYGDIHGYLDISPAKNYDSNIRIEYAFFWVGKYVHVP